MSNIDLLLTLLVGGGLVSTVALIFMWRGRNRHVVCPETGKRVRVELDDTAGDDAKRHLKVVDCDHWPDHAGCNRACEAALRCGGDGFPLVPERGRAGEPSDLLPSTRPKA